jgi:hypothetical protein
MTPIDRPATSTISDVPGLSSLTVATMWRVVD